MQTEDKLGISAEELNTLVRVRDMLSSGEIEHSDTKGLGIYSAPYNAVVFNMAYCAAGASNCGTTCCIGGWMYALMHGRRDESGVLRFDREKAQLYVDSHLALRELFYPNSESGCTTFDYDTITPRQAAQAITNLLETGEPDWSSILDENPDD